MPDKTRKTGRAAAILAAGAVTTIALPATLPVEAEAEIPAGAMSAQAAALAEVAAVYGPAEPVDVYGPAEPVDPYYDDDDDFDLKRDSVVVLYGPAEDPQESQDPMAPWIPVGAGAAAGAITGAVIAIGSKGKKQK